VEGYQRAIVLFERAGAVANAARTSITLVWDQGWHVEFAAAHRTIDRALEVLGSADPQLKLSLLTGRAMVLSTEGDATGAADVLAEVKALWKAADAGAANRGDSASRWRFVGRRRRGALSSV